MRKLLLAATLLYAVSLSGAPKTVRLCIADPHGAGVLVIENIALGELPGIRATVAQSKHRFELPILRTELQAKLGPSHPVHVLTGEEFNSLHK